MRISRGNEDKRTYSLVGEVDMAGAGLPGEGLLVGARVDGLESYACAQRGGVYDAFVRQ